MGDPKVTLKDKFWLHLGLNLDADLYGNYSAGVATTRTSIAGFINSIYLEPYVGHGVEANFKDCAKDDKSCNHGGRSVWELGLKFGPEILGSPNNSMSLLLLGDMHLGIFTGTEQSFYSYNLLPTLILNISDYNIISFSGGLGYYYGDALFGDKTHALMMSFNASMGF